MKDRSVTTSITIMYDGCQGEVPEAEAPETPWEGGGGREVSKEKVWTLLMVNIVF